MSVLVCQFMGRFGNNCLAYLFARGFAEKLGLELRTDPWIGERVFDISHPRPDGRELVRCNELTLLDTWRNDYNAKWDFEKECRGPLVDLEFRGYAQMQRCADYYTKRQAQAWLKLRPEIELACVNAGIVDGAADDRIVCHRRRGDYEGYGYPMLALASYSAAAERFGLNWGDNKAVTILSEEDPTPHAGFLPDDLAFMPDFYRMMRAPTLLRANSSFSWLAALLGNGLVLSPVIDGLEGGKEHVCKFVAGNHPKFANLSFVEDLYIAP